MTTAWIVDISWFVLCETAGGFDPGKKSINVCTQHGFGTCSMKNVRKISNFHETVVKCNIISTIGRAEHNREYPPTEHIVSVTKNNKDQTKLRNWGGEHGKRALLSEPVPVMIAPFGNRAHSACQNPEYTIHHGSHAIFVENFSVYKQKTVS